MSNGFHIRALHAQDFEGWKPLWDGYNAFYGRAGATALEGSITALSWQRFLDPAEPMFAWVAEEAGRLIGLTHFVYHRSTTRSEGTCYLQDLYTHPAQRGKGVARALIQAVYAQAQADGIQRVYWQTHTSNALGRLLYDKVASHEGFIVYAHNV